MTEPPVPITYQLKVFLMGISPMIWRRLLVSGDSMTAELHYILQIVMGWSDEHLNRFTIHGKYYGVYHPGGIFFSDDPSQMRLADLQLREREKFLYIYDLTDRWQHQIRVETIYHPAQPLMAPVCLAGQRAAPPEDCGGVWAFLAKRQHYSSSYAMELISRYSGRRAETVAERYDDIRLLLRWLSLEKFDCDQERQKAEGRSSFCRCTILLATGREQGFQAPSKSKIWWFPIGIRFNLLPIGSLLPPAFCLLQAVNRRLQQYAEGDRSWMDVEEINDANQSSTCS